MDQLGSIIGGAAIWTLLIVGGIRITRARANKRQAAIDVERKKLDDAERAHRTQRRSA